MHLVVLCATRRGLRFLQTLTDLRPDCDLTVFSFREEPWEPPFLDDIRAHVLAHGGTFFEARHVGSPRWASFWQTADVALMFTVSWRYMIPRAVYQRARLGTFVFHDSLLPEYRGFAPTVWAMINGESHTGVSLFEIADEVDSGAIVDQERVPIGADDTIAEVLDRVTGTYLDLLQRNLPSLLEGRAPRRPQDHTRATYTCKRVPEDNLMAWSASTQHTYNLIRATTAPYSGAYTYFQGRKLIVWGARRLDDHRPFVGRIPGRVIEVRPGEGSVVLTGDGALLLTEVQVEGEGRRCAADVLTHITHTLGR